MLEVRNLNAYYGESHVLRDVSVSVQKGEVVVMLGPNGHGKSTLLKSICGLVEEITGRMEFLLTKEDKDLIRNSCLKSLEREGQDLGPVLENELRDEQNKLTDS